jgi:hypothetical protein
MKENSFESKYNGGWSVSTNPAKHNQKRYRYLVHAFNNSNHNMGLITAMNTNPDNHNDTIAPKIDIQNSPEMVKKRYSISCSLIDPDHTGTWGDCGLILEVPDENAIFITAMSDAGTPNYNIDRMEQLAKVSKKSPEYILENSGKNSYNEVVVRGSSSELRGFFIKVYSDTGLPIDNLMAQKMRNLATNLNLPIVEIQVEPNIVFGAHFNEGSQGWKVYHQDITLEIPTIMDKEESYLFCYDRDGIGYFPTREQYTDLIKKYSSDIDIPIQELLDTYEYKLNEHLKPIIIFDNEGRIRGIRGVIGTGKENTFDYNTLSSEFKNQYESRKEQKANSSSGSEIIRLLRSSNFPVDIVRQHVLQHSDLGVSLINEFFDKLRSESKDANITEKGFSEKLSELFNGKKS